MVAVLVVDGQLLTVIFHADSRAEVGDVGLDIQLGIRSAAGPGFQFAGRISRHGSLIDADVVLPDADDAHIGPGHRGHAVVGAAGAFDLELIGEGGAVHIELEVLGNLVAQVHGVIAGVFAPGLAHAAAGGTHGGAGAPQVPALGGQ